MDIWLVIGSALYWASVGFRYLGPVSGYPSELSIWTPVAKYLFLLVVIACAYGAMRSLGVRRGRKVLASIVLAASIALEVVSIGGGWAQRHLLCMALEFFVIGSFMILWGLAFASFEKHQAAQNVIATLLLTVLILLGGHVITASVTLTQLAYGCFAASAAVMLAGHVPCANHHRTPTASQRSHKTISIAQRLAFGLSLGFCSEVARNLGPSAPEGALVALAAATLIACLIVVGRPPHSLYTALPTILLVAVGALYTPFIEGGLSSAVWASAGILWIAWSSFSAVQLSDLKERYGTSELDICLADKFLLALGFVTGGALWACLDVVLETPPVGHTAELCIFAATTVLVLGSAYAMERLVGERRKDAVRNELARTRKERLEEAYGRIAHETNLSKRELEVMKMLAKGYTSVYICEELGVSAGTAKAHTAHIYQKLGIHRKDELLELIEERMEDR